MHSQSPQTPWGSESTLNLFYIKGRLGWKGLRASEFQEEGPFLITGTDFVGGKVDWSRSFRISDERFNESPEIIVRPGDILITKDGTIGKVAFIHDIPFPGQASLNSHLFLVRGRSKNIDQRFAFYIFQSYLFRKYIDSKQTGSTLSGLPQRLFERFEVPLPPIEQQRRIGKMLSTVDEAIEQTEALIAKYQQIKAGLMDDLFTRGVTSDGRLRPTRAEGPYLYKESPLGWIPKEWELDSLGNLAHFITSGSRGWAEYYSESGPLFLRISNLTREHINFRWDSLMRVSLPKFTEGQRTSVLPNDILISITADLGIVGVIGDQIEEAYVNQHIALVRSKFGREVSRFIGHFLSTVSVQKQFLRLNDSGAKAGLNLSAVGKILIAKPLDDAEAGRIASILDKTDQSVEYHKREIAKLRKQKHGLMHDLLTGRIRVKVDESAKD